MAKIFPTDFEEKLTIAEDDYILFSDSEDWNRIKKAQYSNLKWEKGDTWETWPQWEEWPQWPQGEQWPTWATWNWIASITSSKSWKITTVTITETNSTVDTFQISDGADWTGSGDVIWPASSTNWHLAVFDWATGKQIKDWWAMPTIPTKTSDLNNDSGFITSASLPTKVSDLSNDSGFIAASDFEISTVVWATLTISYFTTQITPSANFTLVAGTVKEWMQYIVRVNTWATVYTMSLWTGVTNPFWEDLTLTASKTTTVVLLATSSSTLEIFSIRTAA